MLVLPGCPACQPCLCAGQLSGRAACPWPPAGCCSQDRLPGRHAPTSTVQKKWRVADFCIIKCIKVYILYSNYSIIQYQSSILPFLGVFMAFNLKKYICQSQSVCILVSTCLSFLGQFAWKTFHTPTPTWVYTVTDMTASVSSSNE
jgi:hypothetical protein